MPFLLLIVAMTGIMIALEVRLPYVRYSKILRWLTLSLLTYIAVLFVVKVNWGDVALFVGTALLLMTGLCRSPTSFAEAQGTSVTGTSTTNNAAPVSGSGSKTWIVPGWRTGV